jgi:hypothetical protein
MHASLIMSPLLMVMARENYECKVFMARETNSMQNNQHVHQKSENE